MSGSNAQGPEFAKFGPVPESYLSFNMRRTPGESPFGISENELRIDGPRCGDPTTEPKHFIPTTGAKPPSKAH